MFKQSIERYRPIVRFINKVDSKSNYTATENVTLANIQKESNGVPGLPGYTNVRHGYNDAEMSCARTAGITGALPEKYRKRAGGLLQVAPLTWRSFQAATKQPQITACQLFKQGEHDIWVQLDAGMWAEKQAWKTVVGKKFPSVSDLTDENILLFRLCYHAGSYAFKQQMSKAALAGFPETAQGLEQYNPQWGHPDRPFKGAREVLAAYKDAIGPAPGPIPGPLPPDPIPYPIPVPPDPGKGTGGLALLVLGGLALLALAAGARGPRSAT